jgi:hypothetical protein
MKRRAAVEPVIGHTKQEHRMGRNYLAGRHGDALQLQQEMTLALGCLAGGWRRVALALDLGNLPCTMASLWISRAISQASRGGKR